MDFKALKYWDVETDSDGVVVARLVNPPFHQIGNPASEELSQLIDEWAKPQYRVIILAGKEKGIFIWHFDGDEIMAYPPEWYEQCTLNAVSAVAPFQAALKKLQTLPKPVIAAMNGVAMGGGFETALACDIRIGERGDYKYGVPETRVGLIPGGGGTQRISRICGIGVAMELVLLGRMLTPEEAYEKHVIHMLADDAVKEAKEVAKGLIKRHPLILARAKKVVYDGYEMPLNQGIMLEDQFFKELSGGVPNEIFPVYNAIREPQKRIEYVQTEQGYGDTEKLL